MIKKKQSRLFLFSPGRLVQLMKDQTVVKIVEIMLTGTSVPPKLMLTKI